MLSEYGWSFDLCIRHHQLPAAIELVRRVPETSFVLDHLGKPPIAEGRLDPWREQLAELAGLPNVVCKISGAVTEADHQSWNADDLRPFVAHALDVFGPQRVMFGGDWPVALMASPYRRWVETLDQLTAGLAPAEQQALWRDNARRVYRLNSKLDDTQTENADSCRDTPEAQMPTVYVAPICCAGGLSAPYECSSASLASNTTTALPAAFPSPRAYKVFDQTNLPLRHRVRRPARKATHAEA